jgi:hypothetical protein
MARYARLNDPDPRIAGILQATLYYSRKKKRPPIFTQVFSLTISAGNDISIAGIRNAPSWFNQANFVLEFEDTNTASFTWITDHWELTSGVFTSTSGIATLSQGANSVSIRWQGAEI